MNREKKFIAELGTKLGVELNLLAISVLSFLLLLLLLV